MHDTETIAHRIEDHAAAFLRPRRNGTERMPIPGAQRIVAGPEPRHVHAWSLGDGPAVLLVHGWEGSPSDMAAFVPGLLARGLRVVLVELPAHGESAAPWTSIPHSAMALGDLQAALGPVHGVVGHSVGGAVVAHALGLGMQAGRAVLIAAPARYTDYARRFARQAGLDEADALRMLDVLREVWQVDVHAVSAPATASRLTLPGLLVHATDDRMVPIEDSEQTASQWRGARLMRVEGVGHRRILAHAPVIDAVVEFLTSPA
jgi:pimeloyl-ACP methyl ester carboxylesterase